jgi:hypothetical protein
MMPRSNAINQSRADGGSPGVIAVLVLLVLALVAAPSWRLVTLRRPPRVCLSGTTTG